MNDLDGNPRLPPFFRVGDFLIRPTLKTVRPFHGFDAVSSAAEDHPLTDKSMAVLVLLAERPRQVCSRDFLLDTVWGEDREAFDRVLDNAISEIRRAFGDNSRDPQYIQTIPKQGYRLIAPVERPEPLLDAPVPPPTRDRPWPLASLAKPKGRPPIGSLGEESPRRGATWVFVAGCLLLAAGIWTFFADDALRVAIARPQVVASPIAPSYLAGLLEESLGEASRCTAGFRRRSLSFLAGQRLETRFSSLGDRQQITLRLEGLTTETIEVERESREVDLEALVERVAGELTLEIDRKICRSGWPPGADRACHCGAAGTRLLFRRSYEEARVLLEKADALGSDDPEIYVRLSNLENILGYDQAALDWVDRGLAIAEPGSVDALELERRRAQVRGDVVSELELLQDLREKEPENEEWERVLGWYDVIHRRRCRDSLESYRDALAFGRSHVTLGYYGDALLRCGEAREAIRTFREYLEAEPWNVDAYDSLAQAYRFTGQYEEAGAALRDALRLNPEFPAAVLQRADLTLARASLERAARYFEDYARRFDWPSARAQGECGLARVALARGDWEGAILRAHEALEAKPDAVEALWIQGRAFVETGDLDDAEKCSRRIRALRAGSGSEWQMEFHLHLEALLALARDEPEEALERLLEARHLHPVDRAFFDTEMAEIYRRLGRDEDAMEEYERALASNPRYGPALCGLASLHEKAERLDRALDLYETFDATFDRPEGLEAEACEQRLRALQVRPPSARRAR